MAKNSALSGHENTRGQRKTTAEERPTRAMDDRQVTEDRALSDDERVELFRHQFIQSALPDLPKLDGYHVCWLTTTNPRDTIQSRVRLGYQLIRNEEIPGWEYLSLKSGEFEGYVGVNEMIAAKLPLSLYHRYMEEMHHKAPQAEEDKLRANLESMKEQAERIGGKLYVGDGDEELGKDERLAQFNDD